LNEAATLVRLDLAGAGAGDVTVTGPMMTLAVRTGVDNLTLASADALVSMALFWSFPGSILTGAGVAAGLAAINSVGNLGGFFGPYLLGALTDWLGSPAAGISILGGCMLAAGSLIGAVCRRYGLRSTEESSDVV
jgi:nitrate/nitrite transporter NarK